MQSRLNTVILRARSAAQDLSPYRLTIPGSRFARPGMTILMGALLFTLPGCGIKGSLTPPQQIEKETRSEPSQRQGRDPVRPY